MTATGRPYHDGAPIYRAKDWTGILPLPPGKKSSPPSSYTGWNGRDPSAKMIETWRTETSGEFQAGSNIAIRTPHNVVGIDVDQYGEKTGWNTLCDLEADLCPLPATHTSTARTDGRSGIRWFRVDTDVPLKWPTGPGKDIEFIHFGHRYAVVWPSIHPDTKEQYQWYDHAFLLCEPPEADQLAELPMEWVMRFTGGEIYDGSEPVEPATKEQVSQCLTDGEMCQAVARGIRKYLDESTSIKSHHDAMRDSVMALVRLGEQGHHGGAMAVGTVRGLFEQYAKGRDKYEVDRAIDGAVAKVLAAPTADKDKGCCGSQEKDSAVSKLLPPEFWESTATLKHIRQAAHSRGRCPDVVLYTVLARVASMASPRLVFENWLGTGSLNLFVAVIGPSGAGKSTGAKVGKQLVPIPHSVTLDDYRDGVGIGSGEGLAELYMGMEEVPTGEVYGPRARKAGQPITKAVRCKVRDNAFIYVDEGQALMQQGRRLGTIVFPAMRTAWDAGTLGQANARDETTRHIPEGTYSMGLVIGFQENTVQELIADSTSGTPQRFIWCWAIDETLPDARSDWPGMLNIDDNVFKARTITFYNEINDELWQEDLARNRGQLEIPELDSQRPKMLCKLAALLCLIDGRTFVTLDDWALAKTMYATSSAVLSHLTEYGDDAEDAKHEAYAARHSAREAKAHYAKANVDWDVKRIGALIFKHAMDQGVMPLYQHRKQLHKRDKPLFHEAVEFAKAQSWIGVADGKVTALAGARK